VWRGYLHAFARVGYCNHSYCSYSYDSSPYHRCTSPMPQTPPLTRRTPGTSPSDSDTTAQDASPRGKSNPARVARAAYSTSVFRKALARTLASVPLSADDAELEPLRNRYTAVDHPRVQSFELEQYNFFRCLSAEGVLACWSDRASHDGVRAYVGWCAASQGMEHFGQVYGRVTAFRKLESPLGLPAESPEEVLARWREECLDECTQTALRLVAIVHNHPGYMQLGVPAPVALRTSFPLVWARMQERANPTHANGSHAAAPTPGGWSFVHAAAPPSSSTPSSSTPSTLRTLPTHDVPVEVRAVMGEYNLVTVPHVAAFEREQSTFFMGLSTVGVAKLATLQQESKRDSVRAELGWGTESPGMRQFRDVLDGARRYLQEHSTSKASLQTIVRCWHTECLEEFVLVARRVHQNLHGDDANFIAGVMPRRLYDSFPMVWGLGEPPSPPPEDVTYTE